MVLRQREGTLWWRGRLRQRGLRITSGREAVCKVLTRAKGHLSAEEIYLAARPLYPSIGLTSIYRTLEIMQKMGLVRKSDFGDGRARYELTSSQHQGHHHHLICTCCGRIIDYCDFMDEELEFLKVTEKGLSKKYGFKINDHLIQFSGICDRCQK